MIEEIFDFSKSDFLWKIKKKFNGKLEVKKRQKLDCRF